MACRAGATVVAAVTALTTIAGCGSSSPAALGGDADNGDDGRTDDYGTTDNHGRTDDDRTTDDHGAGASGA